jgi:3-hydroxybutyryl-CoA dehydrogenase
MSNSVVGIVGAGTMGRGIAVASLLAGYSVVLTDQYLSAVNEAEHAIQTLIHLAATKGKITVDQAEAALQKLTVSSTLEHMVPCDIVIEAIVERLEIKQAIFTSLAEIVTSHCILASNTSSISIASIARTIPNPERVAGLHFFNPAHIMKLVEVVKGPRTSDVVVDQCVAYAALLGKTPVVAADVPGFIVNRIARNFYNEPQRIVMERAASIPVTDSLIKAMGFKMGPFELMNLIGVDVNLDVTTSQWEQFYNEPRFTPSMLQRQYVQAGLHGAKTGGGFPTQSE